MAMLPLLPAVLAVAGCGGPSAGDPDLPSVLSSEPWRWAEVAALGGRPSAVCGTGGDELLAAVDGALWRSPDGLSWLETDRTGLPAGELRFLAAFPTEPPTLLAHVHEAGLYRRTEDRWEPVPTPPDSPILRSLNPRASPSPWDLAVDPNDPQVGWLATLGGLYRTDDAGLHWEAAAGLGGAGFNLLFTGVAARGPLVAAVAFLPAGVLPDSASDLLTTAVFLSQDGGETWEDADPEHLVRYPTGVTLDPSGDAWISAQDGGLWRLDQDGMQPMGGPPDALDLEWSRGGINLISGSQGAWRLQQSGWTRLGDGPLTALVGDHAFGWDGSHWRLEPGLGSPAVDEGEVGDQGGATVHIALSMHVNLYHSYRGDSNDAEGYGIDLDVMRDSLAWLSARPELHADWDMDNAWSTDSAWMQEDGADVLAGIQARVAQGTDDLRLMSWNNGAMVAHTREEFDQSIALAWQSNQALFAEVVPGVQPQENMFGPEHLAWYADQGLEWITLAFSGTPFTALRGELDLPEEAWYRPATLQWQGRSLTLVPTYHHGDLLNHGGLAGWVQQLHQARQDDQLLVIHLDADSETWQGFDRELDALEGLPWVRYSTIQDYLDQHPPTVTLPAPAEVADGTGDGFQSWAEKAFNHEIATGIAQARELAAHARALGGDHEPVALLLAEALRPRLLALSTTHFGLAAPSLHADRVASARAWTQQAQQGAQAARDAAEAGAPVEAGTITLLEHRGSTGVALIEATLEIPAAAWTGVDAVRVFDEEDVELAVAVSDLREEGDPVEVDLRFALPVEAHSRRTLRWRLDPGQAPRQGAVDPAATGRAPALGAPFTECDGRADTVGPRTSSHPLTDARLVQANQVDEWELPLCGALGRLRHSRVAIDGLPGLVLEVLAQMPALDEATASLAESVALSPLPCDGAGSSLRWRGFGEETFSRPVRAGSRGWNGQAIDGWLRLDCENGAQIQVSHRVVERTSLAMAPLRSNGSSSFIAPLGTLWGGAPWHDVRQTGGHGMGDLVTGIIGSQFRPSAPDWAGQEIRYRLLLGRGEIDEGTLDLFAHPPWVRVGAVPE